MPGILTYWHTIRHLLPAQIAGRLAVRVLPRRVSHTPAPALRPPSDHWIPPISRAPSLSGPTTFTFLSETHDLDTIGWDPPEVARLWRYNLHYFDDLNAEHASIRSSWHRALMERWCAENPPASGVGWEPFPTSLRICNWAKWSLGGKPLPTTCVQSLAIQARWLSGGLEYHVLGNHLLANAKALIFAGVLFEGDEAREWLNKGLRVLADQLPQQILGDGGHFERSPMYHALVLEDLLDLCNLANAFPAALSAYSESVVAWRRTVMSMRRWLAVMCHPDGDIAFFNDAAFGVAARPADIEAYASRLNFPEGPDVAGESVLALRESGYVRVSSSQAVALLDVARVGPDHLPAHAHADTLSFEMSLFGARMLVNSGTSLYESSHERLRQRGTAAHNTVEIDGADSSEVWDSFRVARRARPGPVEVSVDRGVVRVHCEHDGYRRLRGRPRHLRTWIVEANSLLVVDEIKGGFTTAVARLYLHPSVAVEERASTGGYDSARLTLSDGRTARISMRGGRLAVQRATWHPGFGTTMPTQCLVGTFDGPTLETRIAWTS